MPIMIKRIFNKKSDLFDLVKDHTLKWISLNINEGIGSFYK